MLGLANAISGFQGRGSAGQQNAVALVHALEPVLGRNKAIIAALSPEMGNKPSVCSLWVYAPNVDAAFERATKAGAKPAMPPQDMFWGDRMGAVVDRWGITWNLATHVKDLTPDQLKKAQDVAVAEMAKQKK